MNVKQRLELDEGNVFVYLAHGQHVVLNDGVLQHRQACRTVRHLDSETDDTRATICSTYDPWILARKLTAPAASPPPAENVALPTR